MSVGTSEVDLKRIRHVARGLSASLHKYDDVC